MRFVDSPNGNYDLILSHSSFLFAGDIGHKEKVHTDKRNEKIVRMRRAVGLCVERSLQRFSPLRYELADLEEMISQQNCEKLSAGAERKREALLFF